MNMDKRQRGFTLIEITLSIAVGALVVMGVVTAVLQTTSVTAESSAQIDAMEDIKRIAYRIGKDVRMAGASNLVDGDSPVGSMSLNWTSWYDESGALNPVEHSCQYSLSGGGLQREYDSGSPDVIGRHISSVEFSRDGDVISMVIVAHPDGRAGMTKEKTYLFYLRAKEEPVQ